MRVLMLGWDFSPRLSGGVGSACRGIATALARAGTQVLFVLPRVRGDEEALGVELVASTELERETVRRTPRVGGKAVAAIRSVAARTTATSTSPPPLPSPAESLRLLALDSPLRPYQAPRDYARAVQELLAHLRAGGPTPQPLARRSPHNRASARLRAPRLGAGPDEPARELYAATLLEEVERYARAVLALAARESFQVIHAHDWMTFPAGLLVRQVRRVSLVCQFHSCEAERRGADGSAQVRAIEQAALDVAERIVCVSRRSVGTLGRHHVLQPAKIRVVHNAFSPPSGEPADGRRAARTVLYLGRLAAQKDPEVFLEAARRVHALEPAVRFLMAGEGELFPALQERARALGLARVLRFTGFVADEELARTYTQADVYVMPSRAEPFGLTPLEAASLGVPVIVSRQAGVTEVLRSCLTFEPGDAADLAEKILALLRRPELRRELVRQAAREVREIRWDRPARALRGIYDELVVP
jgi:glycosyltransferase involved in cell wall biosynthesis